MLREHARDGVRGGRDAAATADEGAFPYAALAVESAPVLETAHRRAPSGQSSGKSKESGETKWYYPKIFSGKRLLIFRMRV